MKRLLLLLLLGYGSSYAQTQIGGDIDGEAAGDLSGRSVSLSSDGTIVAIGAINNDGSGTDAGSVRVYSLAAILRSDSFVQANFMLYPNPSNGLLNICLQNNLQLEKVSIYNLLGQLIKTPTTTVINTSELAKGSYYVEVITTQGKATKQVLVQ